MSRAYLVAILCAAWCSACERLRPEFLGADWTDVAMHRLWIDIEDAADVLPDRLDVASLPMLLVAATRTEVTFFGPVRPDLTTIRRLAGTREIDAGADDLLDSVIAHWLEPPPKDTP